MARRHLVVAAAGVVVLVLGIALAYRLLAPAGRDAPLPLAGPTAPSPPYIKGIAETPPAPARAAAPAQAVAPAPHPRVTVDSQGTGAGYPLAAWRTQSQAAGWFDSVELGGTAVTIGAVARLRADDVLHAQGWAGDAELGMRLPHVLLVVCDTVVASVPVNISRPDVAKAVHPHLERSGWRAALFAGDLPMCETMVLRAYGVAPARRLIFPLSGEVTLAVSDAAAGSSAVDVERRGPALRPEAIPEAPPSMRITIQAARANLRRCGDTACPVVGSLAAGEHDALVLDESPEWLLVFSGQGTGWLARRLAGAAGRAETRPNQAPARPSR